MMARHNFRQPAREMSIERALQWAFGEEHASIEFDELGETAHGNRRGIDGIAVMMERGAIGCEIDGGGRSDPAWDAEVIASTLASLPHAWGGRAMALETARLARAGMRPDWMPEDKLRCLPRDWRMTKHGAFARTEVVGEVLYTHRGRKMRRHIVACPVRFTPTAQQVGAARRNYLEWYGALLWTSDQLRSLGILSRVRITQDMPPLTPWNARA